MTKMGALYAAIAQAMIEGKVRPFAEQCEAIARGEKVTDLEAKAWKGWIIYCTNETAPRHSLTRDDLNNGVKLGNIIVCDESGKVISK